MGKERGAGPFRKQNATLLARWKETIKEERGEANFKIPKPKASSEGERNLFLAS